MYCYLLQVIHLQEVADDAMKLSASNGTVVEANIVLSHLPRVSPADGSDSSGNNGDAKNGNGATPARELPYMTSTFMICDPWSHLALFYRARRCICSDSWVGLTEILDVPPSSLGRRKLQYWGVRQIK